MIIARPIGNTLVGRVCEGRDRKSVKKMVGVLAMNLRLCKLKVLYWVVSKRFAKTMRIPYIARCCQKMEERVP